MDNILPFISSNSIAYAEYFLVFCSKYLVSLSAHSNQSPTLSFLFEFVDLLPKGLK